MQTYIHISLQKHMGAYIYPHKRILMHINTLTQANESRTHNLFNGVIKGYHSTKLYLI